MKPEASYILPLRSDRIEQSDELTAYLRWLSSYIEVIVVDGSTPEVFAVHHQRWAQWVKHIPVDGDLATTNGKVGGVLTGVRYATCERLIIADDDVRYDLPALERMIALLDEAHVVRPQNYFDRLPWHARWDTARTLLNRISGGDWPGTLGVRRSALLATGGYNGNVLFENLELVRTIRAAGGIERVPLDLFVCRLAPESRHFWSQRVRQAYDEFARPRRLGFSLALLPLIVVLTRHRRRNLFVLATLSVVLAEIGRRRSNGVAVFGPTSALWAPAWLIERTICSWLAVGMRGYIGGVRYRGGVLRDAATSEAVLQKRFATANVRVPSLTVRR